MYESDPDTVTTLDLGASRFRAVVADVSGEVTPMGWASRPAMGTRRGEVVDLPATATAVRELLHEVWTRADVDPQPVHLTVGGEHVRSLDSRGSVALGSTGAKVRSQHLDSLLEQVRSMDVPFDRMILHCLPVGYAVDDRTGIENPVGMVGTRVALEAHVITAEQSRLGSVQQAVERADADIAGHVFAACASGDYLVSEDERNGGCLAIDIGAETTHFALYCRGRLRRSGAVPVGGNHVTRDVAWGLEVDERTAERLKRRWGTALRTVGVGSTADDGTNPPDEVVARLAAICEARQQELMELVAQGLQWGITRPALASGIVLTGGGSRLRGSDALAEQVFGTRTECRRSTPDDTDVEPDSWAQAFGAARFVAAGGPRRETVETSGSGGFWDAVQGWISHLV